MGAHWRDYRPAIWLAMLGIALALVLSPPYVGAVLIGAAIGVALRTRQRRRTAPGTGPGPRGAKRRP